MMYHFTNAEGTLGYGDERQVKVGETLTVTCKPILCASGLHASSRILYALKYAPGGLRLWEVKLDGIVVHDGDKSVATERTAIRDYGDVTPVIVRFASWCAKRASKHADADAEVKLQERFLQLAILFTSGGTQ